MKKRSIAAVCLCVLALLAGCGGSNKYVTLGDYKNMQIEGAVSEVTDADVQTTIEQMILYYPPYEPTGKEVVETGDIVDIDYEGLLDGVAFAGGTAQSAKLEIGSNSFIDGFEDGLIGAKVGDSLSLNLSFPDPYKRNPDLAGKAVVFNVTVNSIVQQVEMTYDTLTDGYVSEYLNYENVDALKEAVREQIENTNNYYASSIKRNNIIEKLKEICTVNELPEKTLQDRLAKNRALLEKMCEDNGLTVEEYLEQYSGVTQEEFDAQAEEDMRESLELELILLAIAEEEKIELDEEGFETFMASMVSNYSYESKEAMFEDYGEDYMRNSYVCNKVLDHLEETVAFTDAAEPEQDGKDAASGTEEE